MNKSFIKLWESIKNKDIVIFNCHGEPECINGVTVNLLKDLSKKTIKLLVLLACNAGHSYYKWSNVGCTLSKKVTGYVLCSDGTVASRSSKNDNCLFSSLNDQQWKNHTPARYNLGWVMYKTRGNMMTLYYQTPSKKQVTINLIDLILHIYNRY